MKKIFGFLVFVVLCLSTVLISAKNDNILKNNLLHEFDESAIEEIVTDTIKAKKKKSVKEEEIKNENVTDEKQDESVVIEEEVVEIKPGSLSVTTNPKKANVYIDEELSGKTPLKIKEIIPAEYEIRIEKEGYEEIVKTITIQEGEAFVVNETLKEIVEEVEETVQEEVVTEEVKEEEIATEEVVTEKIEEIVQEEVKEKKSKKNKSETEEVVAVEDEKSKGEDKPEVVEVAEIEEEVVEIKPGSLSVTTNPKKANVYIDEELSGKTPLKIKEIIPAEYEIRIEKEGYEEIVKTITIQEGEAFVVNETLKEIVEET
ncbi:MAG: PEGA domain-containing protein, partial [Bacteroidales bacterium]|nr:PEGA domain-containing protein [Bacteroidales bacterium]